MGVVERIRQRGLRHERIELLLCCIADGSAVALGEKPVDIEASLYDGEAAADCGDLERVWCRRRDAAAAQDVARRGADTAVRDRN